MSTALTISGMGAKILWQYDNVLAWSNASNQNSFAYNTTLANGTGAGQADVIYIAQGTITASSSLSLDLAGSLVDIYGNTITMARVKAIYFELTTATSASSVQIGNGSNPFLTWVGAAAHTINVRNGGNFFLGCSDATAYPVTASTGDILKIANNDSGNVATYRLVIVGASV